MRSQAQRIASRYTKASPNNLVVLTKDDYDSLTKEQKRAWKGYTYKMSYEVLRNENETGDPDEFGWEETGSPNYPSLEELLRQVKDKDWLAWSNNRPGPKSHIMSVPEENHRIDSWTTYNLWIERDDNESLSPEERRFIKGTLRF